MIGCNRIGVAVACAIACVSTALATPVAVEWKGAEKMPTAVARPFGGFLSDGSFLVAGGSDFVYDAEVKRKRKTFRKDVLLRSGDGSWSKVGELPEPVAEGVCVEVKDAAAAGASLHGRGGG